MKRSKEQILEKILMVCKKPTNLTAIVYQSNLNFHTVKVHLKRLADAGLLDVSGTDQLTYQTTIEGMKALKHIRAFRYLLMPVSCPQEVLVAEESL